MVESYFSAPWRDLRVARCPFDHTVSGNAKIVISPLTAVK
jgi:hypothetical protein